MRQKNNSHQKIGSLLLSLTLFFTNSALSHAVQANIWEERQKSVQRSESVVRSARNAQLARLTIVPSHPLTTNHELRTMNAFLPTMHYEPRTNNASVFHIQDIHKNIEAQTDIANTIKALINQYDIDVIGLEGAFQEIDFKRFQSYPHKSSVHQMAQHYLKAGDMPGAIHSALIASPSFPPGCGN